MVKRLPWCVNHLGLLGAALLLAWPLAWAEEGVATVSGRIAYSKRGPLMVSLNTAAEVRSNPKIPGHHLILATDGAASREIPFEFTAIPHGRYALRVYQDVNRNGRLDIGLFGPTEPVATYRPTRPVLGPPGFEDMAFTLTGDLREIVIQLP